MYNDYYNDYLIYHNIITIVYNKINTIMSCNHNVCQLYKITNDTQYIT